MVEPVACAQASTAVLQVLVHCEEFEQFAPVAEQCICVQLLLPQEFAFEQELPLLVPAFWQSLFTQVLVHWPFDVQEVPPGLQVPVLQVLDGHWLALVHDCPVMLQCLLPLEPLQVCDGQEPVQVAPVRLQVRPAQVGFVHWELAVQATVASALQVPAQVGVEQSAFPEQLTALFRLQTPRHAAEGQLPSLVQSEVPSWHRCWQAPPLAQVVTCEGHSY